MDALYRAFVKDSLHLNSLPKQFFKVLSANVAVDKLTSASSSFVLAEEILDNIIEGDVFFLYFPNGKIVYKGVITSIEGNSIQTSQIESLFNIDWFYRTNKKTYLEEEIHDIFKDFMTGRIGDIVTTLPTANADNYHKNRVYFVKNGSNYDQYRINKVLNDETQTYSYQMDKVGTTASGYISSITDTMLTNKFGAFSLSYTNSQSKHLTSVEDMTSTRNMEEFIYNLFSRFGVVFDINIPYEGQSSIHIWTPSYGSIKISNNTKNIIGINPKTETEEDNKLIIMSTTGQFRTTYYATKNGIVTNSADTNRLPVINNKIIYSDDSVTDIKNEYLKSEMYNHEIKFDMVIDNDIYDFYSWNLGQPLEIYYRGAYYDTIFTGYSYSIQQGEKVSIVSVTCGKVRTKLTDLINMKKYKGGAS